MAINPELITTIRVDQLPNEPITLTSLLAHQVGTELKQDTVQALVDLVATAVGVSGGVGYIALSVTDGQQLPDVPTDPSFFLCGVGTFLNVNGYPDVICTENLNAVMSLPDHWELAVEIPINPLSGTVQTVTGSAVDNTDPLNPVVNLPSGTGVESVTGTLVDDTDPSNPIVNIPTLQQVLTVGGRAIKIISAYDGDYTIIDSDKNKALILNGDVNLTLNYDISEFTINSEIQITNLVDGIVTINPTGGSYTYNTLVIDSRATAYILKTTSSSCVINYRDREQTVVPERLAKINASSDLGEGFNFHTFFSVGGALFGGERAGSSDAPRFYKFSDPNDLSISEFIEMTFVGAGINGFESLCYDSNTDNFYGMLSNTTKIIRINATDITDYTISDISGHVDFPAGCIFAGSGGICTDETHLYIGTEQTPTCFVLKILISDLSIVDSYEWSRPYIHACNINVAGGYCLFTTNGADCYLLKVNLSDFSNEELQLNIDGLTDDFALLPDFEWAFCGGESNIGASVGGVGINLSTMTAYPLNCLPSTGFFYDADNLLVINTSSLGFVETYNAFDLTDSISTSIDYVKTYTMRGYWVNEWAKVGTDYFVTTWNNTTSGIVKKIELIDFNNPLITKEEVKSRFNETSSGGVTDGDKGDIVVTSSGTVWSIKSALKTAWNSAVTWIATNGENVISAYTWVTTNGSNLLSHLSNTSNPHSTTASQVGAPSGSGTSTGTNTGDNATNSQYSGLQAQIDLKEALSDVGRLSSDYTLSNVNTAQKIFNIGSSGNGSFNALATSLYEFEMLISLTTLSSTSGFFSFSLAGTATFTDLQLETQGTKATLISGSMFYGIMTSASAFQITTASTATVGTLRVKGLVNVNGAGTIIPTITLSQASAGVVKKNSYFSFRKIGASSFTASTNII